MKRGIVKAAVFALSAKVMQLNIEDLKLKISESQIK